ncbi:SpoIIE family protein phosphatase [Streptomyces broussonetiae]|uniref:SpoIIE family protein phosphatase n=1 Tax=Streptomyces broussonetiae TaxID=2686304 RepID=A0ABV5EGF7_9ACTN
MSEAGRTATPGPIPHGLSAAAYVADDQGRITGINRAAEHLLRRAAADLVGLDAHDVLHRDRHGHPVPRAQCQLREAGVAGRVQQGADLWFERGDGTLLPVNWLISPLDANGGTPSTLLLFHARDTDGNEERRRSSAQPLSELGRLALLAELTTQLASTMDTDEAVRRLVSLVVPRLADWAVVDLITENEEVRRAAVITFSDGALVHRRDLQGPMPPIPEHSPMPVARALRGAASALADPGMRQGPPTSGMAAEQRRLFSVTGMHSAAIGPIRGLREVLGALTLGRSDRPEPFTSGDLPLLEDISRRLGLALDNMRLYQRQRKVAETMQRHLLPQLPEIPDLEMTVRYVSAPDASQVGGDWYDAFVLSDGAAALVIGDVVGHDLEAAADMAQLRNMLRAYAWSQQAPPSKIVEWLDHAAMELAEVDMATVIFARVTRAGSAGWELSWTNAGHPPPLLITRDGLTEYLTDGHGILLCSGALLPRADARALLPPGATLLLYTDGLIEVPGESIEEGLERLRRNAASLAHRPLESFTDELVARTRPTDNEDDVAVLALRIPEPEKTGHMHIRDT